MKQQELIGRWDIFLRRMSERFRQSLMQGQQAVLDSLKENDYNYWASLRTLSAVKSQIDDSVIKKIDETWSNQVYPMMEADGHYWTEEMDKGRNLEDTMNKELELWHIETEGKLGDLFFSTAMIHLSQGMQCPRCSAALEMKGNPFVSHYLSCMYCQATHTYIPDSKWAMPWGNVIDSIARYKAIKEYQRMTDVKNVEGTKAVQQSAYEKAAEEYLSRFFEERVLLIPATRETLAQDKEAQRKRLFHQLN